MTPRAASPTPCRTRPSAVQAALAWSATVAFAALALSACAGDGGDEVSLPPPGELDEVRTLRFGEFAIAARPQTCARTRAVVIVAGRPRPRELRLEEGSCFLWANASNDQVVARSSPGARTALGGPPSDAAVHLFPRGVSTPRGPLTVLSRRDAGGLSGGAQQPFRFSSSGVSERGTIAFFPAQGRRRPLRCPSRTLRQPPAARASRLPYRIEPGGARGRIVLDRSRRSSVSRRPRIPRGLKEVTSLACATLTIAERPAGCRTTRAVLIAGRRPEPRELRLPRGSSCVVWGNRDRSDVAVRFDRSAQMETAGGDRRLWPRAAVAWDFFFGSPRGRLDYTVEPGGAEGTIVLE